MSKSFRLEQLEDSYKENIISKKEYEKKKKELEESTEEEVTKPAENKPYKHKKSSDKMLLIGIGIILILFISFFAIGWYFGKEKPKTIDDYHQLNIEGKLNEEDGYLYRDAYSFVKVDDFWYTQLTSPSGQSLYDMNFRYSPRDVEDIKITGKLDVGFFNNESEYYITFNPEAEEFSYITLAIGDYNNHMIRVFSKTPIAACDRNVSEEITTACKDRPIVDCSKNDSIVVYVKVAEEARVIYDNNCIIIEGKEFDLVRGVDRVLYNLYGIME